MPGRAAGLLALHAHPDDETLSTGALLAAWARTGVPVTVVTCTRGERGEVIPADLRPLEGDGPRLAAHRTAELARALDALGVTEHHWLDALVGGPRIEDSGMAWAEPGRAAAGADVPDGAFVRVPVEVAARAVADLLATRRPAVVVGYEPDGGYGHPDHVHAHRVLMRAVGRATAADPAYRPVVLWAAVDADVAEAGRARLRAAVADGVVTPGAGLTASAPRDPLGSAAVPSGTADVVVDVEPVLGDVVRALEAHATQVTVVRSVDGTPAGRALSNGVLEPFLPVEVHRLVAGDGAAVAWPPGVRR